jgi:hypothetical protein
MQLDLIHPLDWLDSTIRQTSKIRESFRSEEDYRIWIWWALNKRFLRMEAPNWAIIARPVSWELWESGTVKKGEELFAVDYKGDALWMDFLYAPHGWDLVVRFLKSTGKRWGGWEHRTTGKVHIVDIYELVKHGKWMSHTLSNVEHVKNGCCAGPDKPAHSE